MCFKFKRLFKKRFIFFKDFQTFWSYHKKYILHGHPVCRHSPPTQLRPRISLYSLHPFYRQCTVSFSLLLHFRMEVSPYQIDFISFQWSDLQSEKKMRNNASILIQLSNHFKECSIHETLWDSENKDRHLHSRVADFTEFTI